MAKAWHRTLSLPGLIVEHREIVGEVIQMSGRLAASSGTCPSCGTRSGSCHSRYDRALFDLPISGIRGGQCALTSANPGHGSFWGLTQIPCTSYHAGAMTLALSRSILARPNIWRLIALRRFIFPST